MTIRFRSDMDANVKNMPAFPTNHETLLYGMTMRDYFAAKAMQGQICGVDGGEATDRFVGEVAAFSYAMADAMLKARES
jgi:hypothetical protein